MPVHKKYLRYVNSSIWFITLGSYSITPISLRIAAITRASLGVLLFDWLPWDSCDPPSVEAMIDWEELSKQQQQHSDDNNRRHTSPQHG